MTDKPQTQKDMLVTLLDKVLVLTEKVVETQSQVVEINHTIHNGMSKAIQDTAKRVTSIEGDMGEVKRGLEKIGTEGHPQFLVGPSTVEKGSRVGLGAWWRALCVGATHHLHQRTVKE